MNQQILEVRGSTFTKHQESAKVKKDSMKTKSTCEKSQVRWRVYRVGAPSNRFPKGEFTEVWDTLNRPFEKTDPVPNGKKATELVNPSFEGLLKMVKTERQKLGVQAPSVWIEEELAKPNFTKEILG